MKMKNVIVVISMLFALPVFAQQPNRSLIPYRQGNLWGYANPDRSIAIKPSFDEANWFVAGYAVVKKGTQYGYINEQGKVVIPFKFYSAKSFSYGYFDNQGQHTAGNKVVKNQDTVLFAGASLNASGHEVCIDTKGRTMSKCPAINENTPGNTQEIISVEPVKQYSMVSNGNLYDKLTDDYKTASDDHTYYIGMKNNKYGVINNTQDVIVPFEYDSIKKIEANGTYYLQVAKNGMYGMYNGNGSTFIPVEKNKLSCVKPVGGNLYIIEAKDGVAYLKDINNQDVVNGNYTDIAYERNNGFILTGNDNTKGFYFLDKKVINPKYAEVRTVRGGDYIMVTTKDGKKGYVNADGVEFFD